VRPGDLEFGVEPIVDAVVAKRRPLLVSDSTGGALRGMHAGSSIVAPIVLRDEVVGLLVLGRRDGGYESFEFSLATAIADVLSSLVRREIADQLEERAAAERRELVERMRSEFAEEMGRVVYVLNACQRLLGQDRDLPADIARAARNAASALDRLGIPLGRLDEVGERALTDGAVPAPGPAAD